MDSTSETVAVVVVTYNSERLLPDLIASLGPGLEGVNWHLTVADNASADDSVGAVRRLAPTATVVEMGRNAGYAAGINAAVAKAGPFTAVLVLNPDVRLTPGCVRTLLGVLRTEGTGIAVPLLVDGDGRLIHTMRRDPAVRRVLGDALLGAVRAGRYPALGEMVTDERRYGAETVTDWAEGSTVLFSAECWERVGPWDESFFLYSEETDFALRARDAGLVTRFTPAARAVHLEGDSKVSPGLWTVLTLNKVRLYGRRHGRVAATAFWAALLLREASRAALGKAPSRMAARALLSPARLRETPGPHTVHRARG
ncbi:glycosyltransferase family 2 protein [Actinoplanes sp. NPDC024001]|uniref:glycosyltransferase family 2 protein n=1 Tax=Actinoplanes sp. NPDC024001 TaxID=3154598 RepID=UPI0033D35C39